MGKTGEVYDKRSQSSCFFTQSNISRTLILEIRRIWESKYDRSLEERLLEIAKNDFFDSQTYLDNLNVKSRIVIVSQSLLQLNRTQLSRLVLINSVEPLSNLRIGHFFL